MDKLRPVLCHSQCMSKTSTNIAAATAALFPDVVKDAFAKRQSLTMRDLLLLESAGVNFVALGGQPSAYEITAFMWLFADRDAFAAALDAGTFKEDLHVWADSISPSMLPAAVRRIADVIKASFAPAEDGEKKKKATGRKP